jgi:hypothetical protein
MSMSNQEIKLLLLVPAFMLAYALAQSLYILSLFPDLLIFGLILTLIIVAAILPLWLVSSNRKSARYWHAPAIQKLAKKPFKRISLITLSLVIAVISNTQINLPSFTCTHKLLCLQVRLKERQLPSVYASQAIGPLLTFLSLGFAFLLLVHPTGSNPRHISKKGSLN